MIHNKPNPAIAEKEVTGSYSHSDKITIKTENLQIKKKNTVWLPDETNQNILQDRKVGSITNDSSLSTLTHIKLSDGTLVTDYTEDQDFVIRLEQMSYEEAENISRQIREYPTEFPMPCMAITAKTINESINKLLKQYNLNQEEQQTFIQLQQQLTTLQPYYPYKQSLIFSYKFLLCKSFIEYRFQMQAVNIERKKDIKQRDTSWITGIKRSSDFENNCSLQDILNLPWKDMTNPNRKFGDALTEIYNSMAIRSRNYNNDFNLYPFSLDVALIPYTGELNICNINKIWALPSISLVGCSVAAAINADGFNMSSSGFFEHDLYHLSSKIYYINKKQMYPKILNWVKIIYQHKSIIESIAGIKFTAVELAIFIIAHEDVSIGKCSGIKPALIDLSNNTHLSSLCDLPSEYEKITYYEIGRAAEFLSYLPTENYTDSQFNQAILKLKENISFIEFNTLNSNGYIHTVGIANELPESINAIIEDIKYNIDSIEKQGVICSCMVANLRMHYKKHRNDDNDKLYPNFIDQNVFLEESFFKKEAKFTIENYNKPLFI